MLNHRGRIARGEFARLAYVIGRRELSGTLVLAERAHRHRVVVRRGYVTAVHVEGHFAPLGRLLRDAGLITDAELRRSLDEVASGAELQGRVLRSMGAASAAQVDETLRRQTELKLERLTMMHDATFEMRDAATSESLPRGGVPLALAPWAYAHLGGRLDADPRAARRACLAMARQDLVLRADLVPGPLERPSDLERRLSRVLGDTALPFEALGRALPGVSPEEVLRAVALLSMVGAVAVDRSAWRRAFAQAPVGRPGFVDHSQDAELGPAFSTAVPPPHREPPRPAASALTPAHRVLGLAPTATLGEIKQAFRRLARSLHPDTHPEADAGARRRLAERFGVVSAAYRELMQREGAPATS